MTQHASGQQGGASKGSWLDRAIDIVRPQPGAPPRPAAPPVHEAQWHKSVERKEIVPGLTVHDVGLSVFGETRSLRDRPGSNEPIGAARQKIAHAMINDAELSHQTGKSRNKVHDPVEPLIRRCTIRRSAPPTNPRCTLRAKPISAAMIRPRARIISGSPQRQIAPTGNSKVGHGRV